MPNTEKLAFDRDIAIKKGLTFVVAKKEKKGGYWVDLKTNIEDLFEAFEYSVNIECFEVAIFATYRIGGIHYWSSRHPEILNSGALTHNDI